MGNSGCAIAFSGLDLHTVNTFDSKVCVRTEVVDYIRSIIIGSKFNFSTQVQIGLPVANDNVSLIVNHAYE